MKPETRGRPTKGLADYAPENPEPFTLPEMGATEKSMRAYLSAVATAVVEGKLHARIAETLISACKTSLVALKQANAKAEIKRLQGMLKAAQALARAGREREAADRLHLGDGGDEASDD